MAEKISVYVIKRKNRDKLSMRYFDPLTGRHVERSTGVSKRREAEKIAAKWEADFLEWQRGLGTIYDSADLAEWETYYGTVAPLSVGSAAVPEPTAMVLACVAVLMLPPPPACVTRRLTTSGQSSASVHQSTNCRGHGYPDTNQGATSARRTTQVDG